MADAEVHAHHDGTDVRLRVSGEVDLTNTDQVAERLQAEISNQTTAVTISLVAVRYLDSVGLRGLFALAERLHRLQVELRVVAPTGSIARRVLDLSGFDQVATVVDG